MGSLGQIFETKMVQLAIRPLFSVLARLRLSGALAWLLRLQIKTVQRSPYADSKESFHILLLPKAGFDEDVATCFKGHQQYHLLSLNRHLPKGVYYGFLPLWVDDNCYRSSDPDINRRKARLRSLWRDILRKMLRKVRIDAVMSGNYCYAAEQEFAAVLEELGVPFIALMKESLKTEGFAAFSKFLYETRRNVFQGAQIMVYSETERDLEVAAGAVAAERISVVGMPRLDRLHRLRQKQYRSGQSVPERPTVLFFAFSPKMGLPRIERKLPQRYEILMPEWESLRFTRVAHSCYEAIVRLARENPDIRVQLKSKMDMLSKHALEECLQTGEELPKNLELIIGGDPISLIQQCSVACSFHSTAIFEVLALGKPIVVPRFDEALEDAYQPYMLNLGSCVSYAHSPQELADTLARMARGPERQNAAVLSEEAKKCIDFYIGNADGKTAERVRAETERVIRAYRERLECP